MNALAVAAYARLGITRRTVEMRDWGNLHRTVRGEWLLPLRDPAECGTTSGYRKHTRDGTPHCEACKQANAVAKRAGTGTLRRAS